MGQSDDAYVGPIIESSPTFDELFTRYHGPIYRYIVGLVGDVEQARDLTQETFLKVYKALARTPNPVLPAWLYRIASNTAFDALRQRRRLTWVPFAPGQEERISAHTPDLSIQCIEHDAIHAALARLTPAQRACLLLRTRDDLSVAEIAHALGMSDAAVKMTLFRAKERFRAAYARDAHRCHCDSP